MLTRVQLLCLGYLAFLMSMAAFGMPNLTSQTTEEAFTPRAVIEPAPIGLPPDRFVWLR